MVYDIGELPTMFLEEIERIKNKQKFVEFFAEESRKRTEYYNNSDIIIDGNENDENQHTNSSL